MNATRRLLFLCALFILTLPAIDQADIASFAFRQGSCSFQTRGNRMQIFRCTFPGKSKVQFKAAGEFAIAAVSTDKVTVVSGSKTSVLPSDIKLTFTIFTNPGDYFLQTGNVVATVTFVEEF